jgi:ATP-dependent Clp protease ATP-binding subunit ClpB
VDFRNAVVIMTSNLGSPYILEHAGDWDKIEKEVQAELKRQFRPEFLNRVDDIIIFRPLGPEQISRIVDIQLKHLDKLLGDRKITVELSPEARKLLAEDGYDPSFGARPLKRTIQKLIQNPLAIAVLDGQFGEGDRIVVKPDGKGGLTFAKK